MSEKNKPHAWLAALVLLFPALQGYAEEPHGSADEHAAASDAFHLATYRTWLFRSFLPDADDDADTLGLEFVSAWGWGNYNVTNISYIEVADYPVGVPGMPPGNPEPGEVADTGINDLLTAFLFSKKGGHHGPHHFGWGFSAQFPTGSGETLSSGKYSLGPAVEYEYIGDRLFIAIVALQLWSVAGDDDRKDVNMMMVKPMVTWDLNEKMEGRLHALWHQRVLEQAVQPAVVRAARWRYPAAVQYRLEGFGVLGTSIQERRSARRRCRT